MKIQAVITAAGKNSRMIKDQVANNIKVQNKLTLPFKDSTVIQETIDNVMKCNVDKCILVVGHYANEIIDAVSDNYDNSIKIIENEPHDVGLSVSLYNGLLNLDGDLVLCVTGDQPTVSSETFENMINCSLNNKNPLNTFSFLRRRKTGLLDTAEGLGMPFVAPRLNLMRYLKNENDNLNPILRKIILDGFNFYGIKEKNELELVNINHLKDYQYLLNNL